MPTAASVNVTPGSFPNTTFTFTYPPNYDNFFDLAGASANTPANGQAMASPLAAESVPLDDTTREWMLSMQSHQNPGPLDSHATSPSSYPTNQSSSFDLMQAANFAAMQAGVLPPDLEGLSNYDFDQLLQQYLHTNSAPENGPVTINPSQVLGGVSQNSGVFGGHSSFSSPAADSPQSMAVGPSACHNSTKPLGPTRPLPKSVGGKQLTRDETGRKVSSRPPPQPIRSSSSPNLAGLNIRPMTSIDTGSRPNPKSNKATAAARSGPSTPTSDEGGAGSVLSVGETPTVCSNCQTTKTPLWRRDPDGQPLCNVSAQGQREHVLHEVADETDPPPCRLADSSTSYTVLFGHYR
jgi:GATA-binding protein